MLLGVNWEDFETSEKFTLQAIQFDSYEVVPEPEAIVMMALGGLGLGFVAYRQRKRRQEGTLVGGKGLQLSA